MKIGIIGAGHPFPYQYQALRDLGFQIILCDKDITKIKEYQDEYYQNYQDLVGKVDVVLISTPPITHKEIISYFINQKIPIIAEKPLFTKYSDLSLIQNIPNFYNILHFAYGLEITWFINNITDLHNIQEIKAYINDPYIVSNHIRAESKSLHGAYLDETINPLSALMRIFQVNPTYISANLKYLPNDDYDYQAISHFKFNEIPVTINVRWNDSNNRDKYIDIYFKNKIIRLDSINQRVINLTTNEILFQGENIRMYNHYYYGFKNYLKNKNNLDIAYNLNKAILEYFK